MDKDWVGLLADEQTGTRPVFADGGHDQQQEDAVTIMAGSARVIEGLPARPAAVRTWVAHRPAPLGTSVCSNLSPTVETRALVEIAVPQVLDNQLQAIDAPGHGLGLVGAHRVSDILAAQRAVPGGVVNDLIALGHGGVLEKTLQLKKRDSAQRPEEPSPKKFAVSDEFGDCSAKLTLWLLWRMGKPI